MFSYQQHEKNWYCKIEKILAKSQAAQVQDENFCMQGYNASKCIRGFSLGFNPSSVSVFWWNPTECTRAHCCFAHRLSAVFVEWMSLQSNTHDAAVRGVDLRQAIFRPLWWDLWTSDWWTGKRVILALADHDLKRVQPLLGNILAFAV